jgi:uncharacterized membrane protein
VKARQRGVQGTERLISGVLRLGVATSLILIAAGSVISFLPTGSYRSGTAEVARLTGSAGSFPRSAAWFFEGLLRCDGQAVIVAGLLILILTPVARVAVSMAVFANERDRTFVAITATVLALLILSFALGKAG